MANDCKCLQAGSYTYHTQPQTKPLPTHSLEYMQLLSFITCLIQSGIA